MILIKIPLPSLPERNKLLLTAKKIRKGAMELYTAQYRYTGTDRLDVTAKGRDPTGKFFAPTWKMVMDSKAGRVSWDEYQKMYRDLMKTSFDRHTRIWESVLNSKGITLVCFCKAGASCHRYLLAGIFQDLGADYKGERSL